MPLWPNKHGVQEYFAYYRNSSEPTGSGTFLSFDAVFSAETDLVFPGAALGGGGGSWVELFEGEGSEPLDIWPRRRAKHVNHDRFCGLRTLV